ncbi:MAG: mechanosensitive ion channel family protein, partial [Lacisediminimonas sp.]|nr:mechanosensitive ion channel family protein [Lacisediminimonas sp.]
ALLLLKAFVARQLHRLTAGGHLQFLNYPGQILDATRPPFLFGVSLLAGLSFIDLPGAWDKRLHYGWILILVTQCAMWGARLIEVAVQRAFDRQRQTDPGSATHLMLVGLAGRMLVWVVATLVVLDNLGFNVTTLMASLGIGGIAVALAVQNILGDVFSSISIALDKPFVIGDFIVVDSYMGTVEYIGMKTTRLRSLGGEQIIFSNAELLKNRIRNYKRMQERRVVLEFGIAHETAMPQIERIPAMVKAAIESMPDEARFDRAHLKGFGDSALLYEVVYFVLSPDFNQHMDIQQAVHLTILRELRQAQVSIAYPTRTLHVMPAPQSAPGDLPFVQGMRSAA